MCAAINKLSLSQPELAHQFSHNFLSLVKKSNRFQASVRVISSGVSEAFFASSTFRVQSTFVLFIFPSVSCLCPVRKILNVRVLW